MMFTLWRKVRRWLSPVDGERLLRDARVERIGEHEVLLYDWPLTKFEAEALKAAWERRYTGPRA